MEKLTAIYRDLLGDFMGGDVIRAYIERLEAEVERMQPVVEAAVSMRKWQRSYDFNPADEENGPIRKFMVAVDAYEPPHSKAEQIIRKAAWGTADGIEARIADALRSAGLLRDDDS